MGAFAQVIRVRSGCLDEYLAAHRVVWPEVEAALRSAGIVDYAIYVYGDLLFATYSYIGDDLEADGSRLAQSPACQRWNAAMARLQEPVSEATSGSWFDLEPIYLLAR